MDEYPYCEGAAKGSARRAVQVLARSPEPILPEGPNFRVDPPGSLANLGPYTEHSP